jgi:hypothetical protein
MKVITLVSPGRPEATAQAMPDGHQHGREHDSGTMSWRSQK